MDIKPTARVTLVTTKGTIETELYAKELPLLCKEFLKNCINKNYVGLEFAKVLPGLIETLQLANATECKHEKNARLKFKPRGAIGLLRVEGTKMSSASGFFISLDPPSNYDSNYVFIGNVVGDSIYNVVKIKDSELIPGSERPLYPVKITDCQVTESYFGDLKERAPVMDEPINRKKQKPAVMLAYDEDIDEEDDNVQPFVVRPAHELLIKKNEGKMNESVNKGRENAASNQVAKSPLNPVSSPLTSAPIERATAVLDQDTNDDIQSAPDNNSEAELVTLHDTGEHSLPHKSKVVRDQSIDPYDPNLDFSDDDISYETLRKHKFICH